MGITLHEFVSYLLVQYCKQASCSHNHSDTTQIITTKVEMGASKPQNPPVQFAEWAVPVVKNKDYKLIVS